MNQPNGNPRCSNFLIMDFETGGLSPRKNPATEFAGVWVESSDLSTIASYETLIKPYDNNLMYEKEALNLTGLSIERMVDEGQDVKMVVETIVKNSELANKDKQRGKKLIVVGHNIQFDIGFLQQIFKYAKVDMSKYFSGDKDYFGNFQPSYLDTLNISRAKFANQEDVVQFNLDAVCVLEDVDLVDAHRAMNDVLATKEVLLKYLQSLRSGGQGSEDSEFRFRNKFKFQF
jgi:DNA polymerase III alpha subunit (gram-positive type)